MHRERVSQREWSRLHWLAPAWPGSPMAATSYRAAVIPPCRSGGLRRTCYSRWEMGSAWTGAASHALPRHRTCNRSGMTRSSPVQRSRALAEDARAFERPRGPTTGDLAHVRRIAPREPRQCFSPVSLRRFFHVCSQQDLHGHHHCWWATMHVARIEDDEPFLGSFAHTGGVGHGNGEGGRSAACAAGHGRLAHGYQLVIQYYCRPHPARNGMAPPADGHRTRELTERRGGGDGHAIRLQVLHDPDPILGVALQAAQRDVHRSRPWVATLDLDEVSFLGGPLELAKKVLCEVCLASVRIDTRLPLRFSREDGRVATDPGITVRESTPGEDRGRVV